MTIAKTVNEQRLWQRHMDLAKIGATAKGGVNREAFTPEEAEARKLLASWAEARGFSCAVDDIGMPLCFYKGETGGCVGHDHLL